MEYVFSMRSAVDVNRDTFRGADEVTLLKSTAGIELSSKTIAVIQRNVAQLGHLLGRIQYLLIEDASEEGWL